MTDREEGFGFAPEDDAPIPYRQRIRDYYQALGYGAPYRWAHYAEVPFAPLDKPLAESRVALVTTAAPYQPGKGDQGPGAPHNAAAKFYTVYSGDSGLDHDLRIAHIAYDRDHTTAEDGNTWFPLPHYAARPRLVGSARWRRAFMACRPIAATARRSTGIAPTFSHAFRKTGSTPSSSPRFDRCVTRP
jgi:D-proline reductase (dithiol) PrdB